MAKVHKSVGNGRGEIKADSISPRLYTVKLQPICPKNNTKSSTSPSVLQYWAASTRVLGLKYCSTCKEVLIVTSFFWFVKEVNVNSASTWLVQEHHRHRCCVQAPGKTHYKNIPVSRSFLSHANLANHAKTHHFTRVCHPDGYIRAIAMYDFARFARFAWDNHVK